MKKLYYLIILTVILGLVLTGCFLSNIGQVPTSEQSGIASLTKGTLVPDNLVGLWLFNGDDDDSSGKGNDGTVYGAEIYEDPSPMGQALIFDGVGNYVGCGQDDSLRPTNAVTVEAWVKYAGFFSDSAGHAIVSEAHGTSNGFMLYQACGAPYNRVRYFVVTEVGRYTGQSSTPLSTETWYHLAMVYDGLKLTLYIDGDYDSSVLAEGTIKWTGTIPNLYIGSTYTAGGAKFNGTIDEVRIWNTALTIEQLGSVIVAMDIKPESCPNPLNVNSKGVLPVAILGTEFFDVTLIDPSSIILEGVAPLRWDWEDVATPYDPSGEVEEYMCTTDGSDGYLDLTLKFKTQEVVAALGDVSDGYVLVLRLTGNLLEEFGGTPILGEDIIIIIEKGK